MERSAEILEKVLMLQGLLQRYLRQSHEKRGPVADKTRGQGRVLALLKMQSPISSKELSYLLGIRQQSLNELLNKLEHNEYIKRTPSDEDKRIMLVTLTEKGQNVKQENTQCSDICEVLTEEEQIQFLGYIEALSQQLEEKLDMTDSDYRRKIEKRMRKINRR